MKKLLVIIFMVSSYIHANTLNINILYIEELVKKPATLSNVIEEPKDSALKGIELAIKDSNKSARFLNQKYTLKTAISYEQKLLIDKIKDWQKEGNSFVILNVQNNLLNQITKIPELKKLVLINSTNQDTSFRLTSCNKNLLHTMPSNAMKSDALIQFLIKRDLKKWLLIKGNNIKDEEIAQSLRNSAKKFGAKIIEEKTWKLNADIRRKAQLEIPTFTQGKEYDVVLTADYYGDFGEYLYFNTWLPRPIAGTQGLRAVAWDRVIEQWGAAQLQNRFRKYAKRFMNEKDYSSWVATRAIVAAVTKTKSTDAKINLDYLYNKDFEMGAHKGRKLSFRDFNGQLRMPISLVHPQALVSTSPQVGYLHPTNDLDTLGIASYQVKCKQ